MPKNPHANFRPTLESYSGQGAFRFWCQMTLPLTYDDSLSYYELLNKVVTYLNNTIKDVGTVEDNVTALNDAYGKLENYVNTYFDEIDIEAELRNVLDAMAEDGSLDSLLDPLVAERLGSVVAEQIDNVVANQIGGAVSEQIDEAVLENLPTVVPDVVSEWLEKNVTPTTPIVDNTLTISRAAADAKVTGDEISDLKSANSYIPSLNPISAPFPHGITYTENTDGSITANGTSDGLSRCYKWQYTDGFPTGMKAGDKILCAITGEKPVNLTGMIIFRANDTSLYHENIRDTIELTIPDNASGISIGVMVGANKTVDNETIHFSVIVLPPLEKSVFDNYASEITTDLTNAQNEINNANTEIENRIIKNILLTFGDFGTKLSGGLTFTWDSAHEKCTVTGTTTADISLDALWLYTSGLPAQIKPGEKYDIKFKSTKETPDVSYRIYYRFENNVVRFYDYYSDATIEVPSNCNGITIRLNVLGINKTVNETVTFSMRENLTTNTGLNDVAKMYSIGSSFLTGAIYPTGNMGGLDHLCSFENSPWGNVAIGLGIPESNVTHRLVSSTGLLYDGGYGSILSILKATNLSSYDYVLTQYNRPDLGTSASSPGFPLGDLSSTAGDGTIIGAILDLLSYMRNNAPNATLIMVGAPPSDQRDAYSGQYVFTARYYNGVSIGEADSMISKIAAREHFIFIGWEDLNLSYYYRSLCYGDGNVHPTHDETCRAMGLYLARQCNYNTAIVKTLQADL